MLSTVVWKSRRIAHLLRTALRKRGMRGLVDEGARIASMMAVIPAALAREYLFDVRRGVRTRGYLRNEDHISPRSAGGDARYYQPIGLRPLRALVPTIPLTPATTSFLDLGAGRGRAVLLAAELGFGTVVGVELDERLAREGQENVERWRRSRPGSGRSGHAVQIVQGDAATAPLPPGPLVVALFNSFGATTLRMVLDRILAEERHGDLYFAYINPVHADVITSEYPRLAPHSAGDSWRVFHAQAAVPSGPSVA